MSFCRIALVSSSLLIVGCAKGVEDSGFDTFVPTTATTRPGDTGDDTADTTGSADSDGTTGAVSASGSMTTTDDPTTSTTNDATTSDDTTTGNTTMTTASDTTTSGGTMMGTEDLQNHDGTCEMVLWCTDNMTMEGVGPHAYAECFTNVGLTPPYDVTRVTYQIGQLQVAPTQFTLEVRQWTGSAPGAVIGSQALTGADAALGDHTINLTNPIQVNASSFCIAVDGNDAYAVSYDVDGPLPDQALLTADNCGITTYTALPDVGSGFPGNLCISARIEN